MYNPGATIEAIQDEEKVLGVKFSDCLVEMLLVINGMEYNENWTFYSVLIKSNPKAKYGYFRVENSNNEYGIPSENLFQIAADGYGNHLVLKNVNGVLDSIIYMWNHETNKITRSKITLDKVVAKGKQMIEKINKIHEKHGIK
jgi:hypothetical protein